MGQRKRLEAKIEELKVSIRESSHLALKEDMIRMQRVLRRLGFLTSDNVIELKGRVAVEINAGDELLLTEMIFDGVVFGPDAARGGSGAVGVCVSGQVEGGSVDQPQADRGVEQDEGVGAADRAGQAGLQARVESGRVRGLVPAAPGPRSVGVGVWLFLCRRLLAHGRV